MEGLRTIDTSGYPKVTLPASFGKPARLEWIAIKHLVIDPEYQRPVTAAGRKNVIKIAMQFKRSMFTLVIVSPVGSDRYAIVDGQHRATASAIIGLDRVPCCVIDAVRHEQAAAFKAINANITRMHTTSLLHAAIAARDAAALRMNDIATRAGVRILRYPVPASKMRAGDTIAVTAVRKMIERFGDEISLLALSLLRHAGGGIPGSFKQQSIIGTAEVLADHPEWVRQPARLTKAFSDLDIPVMLMDAFEQSAKRRGVSPISMFEAALLEAIKESFAEQAA